MKRVLPLFILIAMFAVRTYAGGFQINEHGARAMAMGGAFTALANDPSAVYFNPAGITQLNGTQFYFGTTIITPLATYTSPIEKEYEMTTQFFTPINFYVTHQFTENFSAGLSVNNQFGLGTLWSETWPGRYLAVETDLKTFFGTLVLAYKFSDMFSISAGVMYAFGDVTIARKLPHPVSSALGDIDLNLTGDGSGVGFTGGLLFKPTDEFQIGVSYRSEVEFDLEGTAVSTPATFYHPLLKVNLPLPNGNITAPLTTPQNLTFGIAYMSSENLTLTADFQYIGWSSYEKLELTFESYDFDLNPANGMQNVQSADRKYENTFIVRGGFEYTVSESFKLRGGLLYDNNPVQDEYVEPTLPDSDRIGFNIGYGAKLSECLTLDVSYMYLHFMNRGIGGSKFGFNGTYSNSAHLFGVNFAYSL